MSKSHAPYLAVKVGVSLGALLSIVQLVSVHIESISQAQSVSIPLLASLNNLELQQQTLQEQIELAELESLPRTTQLQEQVQAHVLHANESALPRTVHMLESYLDAATTNKALRLRSALRTNKVGATHTISFQADVRTDAFKQLQAIIALSGRYTVYDALTPKQRAMLIEQTESLSPEAILELEDFFAIPLPEFALNSEAHIETLLRSFNGGQFSTILQSVLSTGPIATTAALHGADSLLQAELWPYPLQTIHSLSSTPSTVKDWQTVSVTIILSAL